MFYVHKNYIYIGYAYVNHSTEVLTCENQMVCAQLSGSVTN